MNDELKVKTVPTIVNIDATIKILISDYSGKYIADNLIKFDINLEVNQRFKELEEKQQKLTGQEKDELQFLEQKQKKWNKYPKILTAEEKEELKTLLKKRDDCSEASIQAPKEQLSQVESDKLKKLLTEQNKEFTKEDEEDLDRLKSRKEFLKTKAKGHESQSKSGFEPEEEIEFLKLLPEEIERSKIENQKNKFFKMPTTIVQIKKFIELSKEERSAFLDELRKGDGEVSRIIGESYKKISQYYDDLQHTQKKEFLKQLPKVEEAKEQLIRNMRTDDGKNQLMMQAKFERAKMMSAATPVIIGESGKLYDLMEIAKPFSELTEEEKIKISSVTSSKEIPEGATKIIQEARCRVAILFCDGPTGQGIFTFNKKKHDDFMALPLQQQKIRRDNIGIDTTKLQESITKAQQDREDTLSKCLKDINSKMNGKLAENTQNKILKALNIYYTKQKNPNIDQIVKDLKDAAGIQKFLVSEIKVSTIDVDWIIKEGCALTPKEKRVAINKAANEAQETKEAAPNPSKEAAPNSSKESEQITSKESEQITSKDGHTKKKAKKSEKKPPEEEAQPKPAKKEKRTKKNAEETITSITQQEVDTAMTRLDELSKIIKANAAGGNNNPSYNLLQHKKLKPDKSNKSKKNANLR